MVLVEIFSCILVSLTLVYLCVQKRFSYFKQHGFLYEIPTFPLGNLTRGEHPADVFKKIYDKFKGRVPAFGLFFTVNANFMICDLDVAKDILHTQFETFHNRGLYFNKRDDPLSCHLLTLENLEWKNMRTRLSPTFTSGKMKIMFNTLLDVSDHMILKLKSKKNLDMIEVKEVFAQYTTDVIGNVAFGLEMNAIDDPKSEFRKYGAKFFARGSNLLIKFLFLASFKDLGRRLRMRIIPKEISDFFLKVVKATVKYRLENNINRADMLGLLLKIKEDDKSFGRLSDEEIAAQCFLFFIGGFETSSSTGTFALYNLVRNQEVQEKVRDEIKTVLANHKNKITYEAVQEMKYLQMVIDETLRLYPPVFQVIRQAGKAYRIPKSDLTIPKSSLVIIPTYCIHRDPEYYPDPEKFIPERFNDVNKVSRHPMAYIPFGSGNRNCIGFRFGLLQTKIGLIQLLLNFKILVTDKTPNPIMFEPTVPVLSSSTDMWLRFEKN